MVKKILVGLMVAAVIWLMISLIVTYVSLELNKTPFSLFTWLPNFVLRVIQLDVANLQQDKYPMLISVMTLVVGFLITITPIFGTFRRTGRLRREVKDAQQEFLAEHGIAINPIQKKGKDDLEWMFPYYQQAGRITIFAGSFDWLGDNRQIKERIRQLATENNLRLVSYRTKEQVEAAFRRKGEQGFFRELQTHFSYESGLEGVTCTMIEKLGADWEFLYRSRAGPETPSVFNVCYIGTTPRNIELLNILSKLAKAVEHQSESVHTPGSGSAEQG